MPEFVQRSGKGYLAEMLVQGRGKSRSDLRIGIGNYDVQQLHRPPFRSWGSAAVPRVSCYFASARSAEGSKGSGWNLPFCLRRISTLPSAASSSCRQEFDSFTPS